MLQNMVGYVDNSLCLTADPLSPNELQLLKPSHV